MPQSRVAGQRSASSASNASDEDTDDHKSGSRTQSRIDKWKAKHEAMLKMASKDKKKNIENHEQKSASSEDEAPAPNDLKAAAAYSLTKQLPPPPAALSVKWTYHWEPFWLFLDPKSYPYKNANN